MAKMLSQPRVEELLDYASSYGQFDENTPYGTPSECGGTPMCLERKCAIVAYKKVLGLLPDTYGFPCETFPEATP